eukprot:m.1350521 g.1350521  ORF g.1350521 m.1350521 type:complete len:802 (-) comp24922_c0_seq8:2482-4887(-)
MGVPSQSKAKLGSQPLGRLCLAVLWPRGLLRGRRKMWVFLAVFFLWYMKRQTDSSAEPLVQDGDNGDIQEEESVVVLPYGCELPDEDSGERILSALSRTKTAACRNTLAEAYCKLQDGSLFATPFALHPRCDYGPKSTGTKGWTQAEQYNHTGPVRIAFLFNVYQTGMYHQIVRLFYTVYHPQHFYVFHVDHRSVLLTALLRQFAAQFDNVVLTPFQYETIWASTALYRTYLESLKFLQQWNWDFFINLSEACYPSAPHADLMKFLDKHRGRNFLKSSAAKDEDRFVTRQGVNHTFYQCDNHGYDIGVRELPATDDAGLRFHFRGGSDWYVLSREFVDYVVDDNDPYLVHAKQWYNFSLLGAESFFHSVALNGPFCESVMWYNLRHENWLERHRGCQCTKEWVDWCGCSPLVFVEKQIESLLELEGIFFARKFDPRVDGRILFEIESQALGSDVTSQQFGVSDPRTKDDPYLEVLFWRNHGHVSAVDRLFFLNVHALLAALLSKVTAGCTERFVAPVDGTLRHIDSIWAVHDHPDGSQNGVRGFAMGIGHEDTDAVQFRGLVHAQPTHETELQDNTGNLTLQSGYDPKALVFRHPFLRSDKQIHALISLDKPPNTVNPCLKFGGLLHLDGKACCADTCGDFCGDPMCHAGVGGSKGCCSGVIVKAKKICSPAQPAPCTLADTEKINTSLIVTWSTHPTGNDGTTIVSVSPHRKVFDVKLPMMPTPGVLQVQVNIMFDRNGDSIRVGRLSTSGLVFGEGHDLSDLFSDFYAVATHSPKPCASPPVCGLDACTGNVLGRIAVG